MPDTQERMAEWTIESQKPYADPFNDVDVDVVFSNGTQSWRVPAFWRGGQQWGIRFSPPNPGTYDYHLESTDKTNPDLNGHEGRIAIRAYSGNSELLKHGPFRISPDKRHLEHIDGTPFFWLGDTWWTGLSSRLPWSGFQELTVDRQRKGFTVVQIVAGFVPFEEVCPSDPGCQNEGGPVWTPDLTKVNPKFFDFADRRIEFLVNSGIAPAIVGAWRDVLYQIGASKIKKHWRYLVARYGAYPVFWIVGGEVFDPPIQSYKRAPAHLQDKDKIPGAWTSIATYIRSTDPYHHPISVHELSMDDPPLQYESLTDFRLFQPAHYGWSSIAAEVAQLDLHYARTSVTKPLVVGEIGYELLGKTHLEDFQRVAFWLAMLNGAAGFTYGSVGTYEAYTADKPFQRIKYSFLTWEESMSLPGSYQVGLGSNLIRQYPWWKFQPHPEWITPSGTTLFEPRGGLDDFHIDVASVRQQDPKPISSAASRGDEWTAHDGNFLLPYAAGIPGETRVVYIPYFRLEPEPPTIRSLEPGVLYRAYYWEPSLGIKVDLGAIERTESPENGAQQSRTVGKPRNWRYYGAPYGTCSERGQASQQRLGTSDAFNEADAVVSTNATGTTDVAIILRFQNVDNFVEAVYSRSRREIYLLEHKSGNAGLPLGATRTFDAKQTPVRITSELKGEFGVVSITDGTKTITSPIVPISVLEKGLVGLALDCDEEFPNINSLIVRRPQKTPLDHARDRRLYDAAGRYRGTLDGPGWSDYGKDKNVLLDAYSPPPPPTPGDWVLVLDRVTSSGLSHHN